MIKENLGKCNAYIEHYYGTDDFFMGSVCLYDYRFHSLREFKRVCQSNRKYDFTIGEYINQYDECVDCNVTKTVTDYLESPQWRRFDVLFSYGKVIAIYFHETEEYYLFPLWKYSTTTRQHLSKFMRKHGHYYITDDFKPENGVYFAYGYASGAWVWRY